MTTSMRAHFWAITAIGATDQPHRTGSAASHSDAWMHALAAGRAALLSGELDDLAITVDDELPTAMYTPGRDENEAIDPGAITAALVEFHQAATFTEVADRLVALSS